MVGSLLGWYLHLGSGICGVLIRELEYRDVHLQLRDRKSTSKDVDLISDLEFFDALTDNYQREKDEGPPMSYKDRVMAKIF